MRVELLELDAVDGDFTRVKKLDKLPVTKVFLMALNNRKKRMI